MISIPIFSRSVLTIFYEINDFFNCTKTANNPDAYGKSTIYACSTHIVVDQNQPGSDFFYLWNKNIFLLSTVSITAWQSAVGRGLGKCRGRSRGKGNVVGGRGECWSGEAIKA